MDVIRLLSASLSIYFCIFVGILAHVLKLFQPIPSHVVLKTLNAYVMNIGVPALVFLSLADADFSDATMYLFIAADTLVKLILAPGLWAVHSFQFQRRRAAAAAAAAAAADDDDDNDLEGDFYTKYLADFMVLAFPNTFVIGIPLLSGFFDHGRVIRAMSIIMAAQALLLFPFCFVIGEMAVQARKTSARVVGTEGEASSTEAKLPCSCLPRPLQIALTAFLRISRGPAALATFGGIAFSLVSRSAGFRITDHNLKPMHGCFDALARSLFGVALVSMGLFTINTTSEGDGIDGDDKGGATDNLVSEEDTSGGAGASIGPMDVESIVPPSRKSRNWYERLCLLPWDSLLLRFAVAPAIAVIASLVVGLRGEAFKMFVLMWTLPVAIVAFNISVLFNARPKLLEFGVTIGTILSIPICIAYYVILELVAGQV